MTPTRTAYVQLAFAAILAVVGAGVVAANLSDNVSVLAAHWKAIAGGLGVIGCGVVMGVQGAMTLRQVMPPVVPPKDDAARRLDAELEIWKRAAVNAAVSGNVEARTAAVDGFEAVLKGGA